MLPPSPQCTLTLLQQQMRQLHHPHYAGSERVGVLKTAARRVRKVSAPPFPSVYTHSAAAASAKAVGKASAPGECSPPLTLLQQQMCQLHHPH